MLLYDSLVTSVSVEENKGTSKGCGPAKHLVYAV